VPLIAPAVSFGGAEQADERAAVASASTIRGVYITVDAVRGGSCGFERQYVASERAAESFDPASVSFGRQSMSLQRHLMAFAWQSMAFTWQSLPFTRQSMSNVRATVASRGSLVPFAVPRVPLGNQSLPFLLPWVLLFQQWLALRAPRVRFERTTVTNA